MEHLIDKDALVAEIERRKKRNVLNEGAFEEDIDILSFLNALEVKEVDLNEEIDDYMTKEWDGIEEDKHFYDMIKSDLSDIAKHFFELGLKAQKG